MVEVCALAYPQSPLGTRLAEIGATTEQSSAASATSAELQRSQLEGAVQVIKVLVRCISTMSTCQQVLWILLARIGHRLVAYEYSKCNFVCSVYLFQAYITSAHCRPTSANELEELLKRALDAGGAPLAVELPEAARARRPERYSNLRFTRHEYRSKSLLNVQPFVGTVPVQLYPELDEERQASRFLVKFHGPLLAKKRQQLARDILAKREARARGLKSALKK